MAKGFSGEGTGAERGADSDKATLNNYSPSELQTEGKQTQWRQTACDVNERDVAK